MDTHETAEQSQLLRKQIFKNLNEVLNKSNYEELLTQKKGLTKLKLKIRNSKSIILPIKLRCIRMVKEIARMLLKMFLVLDEQ